MRNSDRKKIIIGYRYDPESYTAQRLQEVQTIHDQFCDEYLPIDSVRRTFQSDQKLIEKLKIQNLLLKAQLQRVQQKSSFKSYQQLSNLHEQLKNQYKKLVQQVLGLKNQIKQLQERLLNQNQEKQIKNHDRFQTRDGRKYTFSPHYDIDAEKLKSMEETNRNTNDESNQNRFQETLYKESRSSNIELNQQENSKNLYKKEFYTKNPFVNAIDSEYLYNDLRTIESQKSHQLESQIHLGYNFSFMPKPLKKIVQTLKALEDQPDQSNFNYQTKANFTFSSKEMRQIDNHNQYSPSLNLSKQTIALSENQSETNIGKLNGLKKLPDKPRRNPSLNTIQNSLLSQDS